MADATRTTLRWRTAFAATLATAMGIGPFCLIAVSTLAPTVVGELGLSRTALGSLATVTFASAAATSVMVGGRVDLLSGRAVLCWVFAVAGVAVVAIASAQSLTGLWVGSALAGVSQGVSIPITNQLVAVHVPSGRQGLQTGVKQSGVQMAQVIIGFTLPPLALLAGWRVSILAGVLIAALGALAAWFIIPGSSASSRGGAGAARPALDPTVWWLTAYSFAAASTITTVGLYVPLYSFERVGLTAAAAGIATGVIGGAGMVARIALGRVAERWDAPIRALTVLSAFAFGSVLLVLVSEHAGAWALWPGLVGWGASALAANAVVMLAVIRGAATGRTGRASGVVGLGLFLGFMAGPLGFGALVDRTDSYTVGWSAVALMSLLALAITVAWQWSRRHGAATA